MRRTALLVAFAFGFVVAALPGIAAAQGDSSSESEAEPSESTETSGESENKGASENEETGGGDEKEKDETEKEKSKEEGAEEASESTSNEKESSPEERNAEKGSDEGEEVPEEGPGGQKLRQDYPGTEESKTGQMESDRIEGLKFDEGEEPGKAYDVEIQELETKVDDLKEKVFQSKSRVVLLKETVLGGNLSGSRAMIVHSNEIGGNFRLRRAMFSLDGNRIFDESGQNEKLEREKFKVYDGNIGSGSHNVSILLEYQGSGYGVFNYMKAYEMKITSSCQFEAEPGKATVLRVAAVKNGGAVEEAMKNADVRCKIETTDISQQEVQSDSGEGAGGEKLSTEEESNE
jgi:hypothetical protein